MLQAHGWCSPTRVRIMASRFKQAVYRISSDNGHQLMINRPASPATWRPYLPVAASWKYLTLRLSILWASVSLRAKASCVVRWVSRWMSIIVFIDFDFIYNVIHRFTLYRLTFVFTWCCLPCFYFFLAIFLFTLLLQRWTADEDCQLADDTGQVTVTTRVPQIRPLANTVHVKGFYLFIYLLIYLRQPQRQRNETTESLDQRQWTTSNHREGTEAKDGEQMR